MQGDSYEGPRFVLKWGSQQPSGNGDTIEGCISEWKAVSVPPNVWNDR
jgi:hypothetical protein